jgi:catechol 2,3-dioxygenase-like lactoylglutathione lyase family enzyme
LSGAARLAKLNISLQEAVVMAKAEVDLAVPMLPARDMDETVAFYGRLGFEPVFRVPDPEGYVILRREAFELQFFRWPELDPASAYSGCYLRVSDVERLYRDFAVARLPARGIPSLSGIERKFFGMREFRLVDPNGNLLRVGQLTDHPLVSRSPRGASPGRPNA